MAVRSPCISVCALDSEDICIGCFRSASEITRWKLMTDTEKHQVLILAGERNRAVNPFAAPAGGSGQK